MDDKNWFEKLWDDLDQNTDRILPEEEFIALLSQKAIENQFRKKVNYTRIVWVAAAAILLMLIADVYTISQSLAEPTIDVFNYSEIFTPYETFQY